MTENLWETVSFTPNSLTQRMKVDGGYLYSRICGTKQISENICLTMSFVPDIDLQRYQAHLRDAYKKGYADGHTDAHNGVKQSNLEGN